MLFETYPLSMLWHGTCSQPLQVQNAEEGPEVEVHRMEVDGVDEEGAVDGST